MTLLAQIASAWTRERIRAEHVDVTEPTIDVGAVADGASFNVSLVDSPAYTLEHRIWWAMVDNNSNATVFVDAQGSSIKISPGLGREIPFHHGIRELKVRASGAAIAAGEVHVTPRIAKEAPPA